MNISQISPTRLERSRQLARAKTARRGHELLKDKSTEMQRKLTELTNKNVDLRAKLEYEIIRAQQLFLEASANMSPTQIQNAITSAYTDFFVQKNTEKIMGVEVPRITIIPSKAGYENFYTTTHPSFDKSVSIVKGFAEKLVNLACSEKSTTILTSEIEKLRRRINALEYKVIPEIHSNIRYITLKLAENERGNLVRLMKVKEILQQPE